MSNSLTRRAAISVVVPCFNEEEVIQATYQRLVEVLGALPDIDFELVFVDDGSRDRTALLLRGFQSADPRVRAVLFSRNFGHQMAVTAGIEHTSGDAVVLIDADLQDPPEIIEQMLVLWRRGAEVVYGTRATRKGEGALKLWTAKTFYRWINRISDTAIPLDTGDFRLMDRKVVDAFLAMPERDRFVRGMVAWLGFRQESVQYQRAARFAGETKYPWRKMVRLALDGALSFSLMPLRLAIWIGFMTAGIAVLGVVYALLVRLFTNQWVPGWTLLFIACLAIGGVQLVCLGAVGEYVGRIYGEVKRRPLYIVRDRLGFNEERVTVSPREQVRMISNRAPGSIGTVIQET
jgi:glycosyltransferase involved in cell wall biosynthesis